MPIQACKTNGTTGKRWGKHGKCYRGPGAKAKAARQAAAARANGYEGHCECLRCKIKKLLAKAAPTNHAERRAGYCRVVQTINFSEGQYEIPGCWTFAIGTHRGKPYTRDDLDDMEENFEKFSKGEKAIMRVPQVWGHEEADLQRSDLPSYAWAKNAYRDGDDFRVDWENVSPEAADLIRQGRFSTVSAEIYDDDNLPAECKAAGAKGLMLRRVAFLGGDIPQVKTEKNRIPTPTKNAELGTSWHLCRFSVRACTQNPCGTWTIFSEVKPMNRDDMLKALAEMGFKPEALKGASDEALAEILRVYSEEDDEDEEEAKKLAEEEEAKKLAEEEAKKKADETPPEKKPSEYSDDEINAMPSEKQAALYKARYAEAEKMADDAAATPKPSQVTMKYAEQKRVVGEFVKEAAKPMLDELRKEFAPIQADFAKFKEETHSDKKRAKVKNAIATHVEGGRIQPSELDDGDGLPGLEDDLMLLDDSRTVTKFSEGTGKAKRTIELTQLDVALRKIAARKPQKFGERAKSGSGKTPAAEQAAEEVEKVQRFCEDNANFTRALEAAGKTPSDFVREFEAARKKNPALTAEQYGVPAE